MLEQWHHSKGQTDGGAHGATTIHVGSDRVQGLKLLQTTVYKRDCPWRHCPFYVSLMVHLVLWFAEGSPEKYILGLKLGIKHIKKVLSNLEFHQAPVMMHVITKQDADKPQATRVGLMYIQIIRARFSWSCLHALLSAADAWSQQTSCKVCQAQKARTWNSPFKLAG